MGNGHSVHSWRDLHAPCQTSSTRLGHSFRNYAGA
jgi:hypothetical protein